MNKTPTLRVWPNPFHALDHEGHPAGVLSYEPVGDGVNTFDSRRFVGAILKSSVVQKAIEGTAQQTLQRTWFEYCEEPVELPSTPYYKHAIARGELFAADEATGKQCGITLGFVKPEIFLERAKKEAIEAYERNLPHEDLDALAPDELVNFSFGPMSVASAARKMREEEAKKAEESQKKRDDEARAVEAKGIAERADRRAKRDAESATDAAEKANAKAKADAEIAKAEAAKNAEPPKGPGRGSKGDV